MDGVGKDMFKLGIIGSWMVARDRELWRKILKKGPSKRAVVL